MSTTIDLHGGPLDGTTTEAYDPWPRSSITVISGGASYRYWVEEDVSTTDAYFNDWTEAQGDTDYDPLDEAQGLPGDPGPPGPTGAAGPTGPAGPNLEWLGDYSAISVYGQFDAVFYQGSAYYMFNPVSPAAGTPPSNNTYWAKLATSVDPQGLWVSGTTYKIGDEVVSPADGAGYLCIADTAGTTDPSTSADWRLAVMPGATGPTGLTGPDGPAGPPGPPSGTPAARASSTYTTAALASGGQETGRIATTGVGIRMIRIATDRPARVRIYTDPTKRDADASRVIGADPTGNHGLLLEVITTAAILSLDLSPEVMASNLEAVPTANMPITITRLDTGGSHTVTVTLDNQAVE
jgi:hypothetical protein